MQWEVLTLAITGKYNLPHHDIKKFNSETHFCSFLNPCAVNTYYVVGTAVDLKTGSLSSESSISPLSPVGGFISTPPFPLVGPQGMPAG